jgi:threonine synthase
MRFSFVCRNCHGRYSIEEPIWRCACGSLLDIEREGEFSFDSVERWDRGLWRYRAFLPVREDKNRIFLGEGSTALVPLDLDGRQIWIKQEQCSPTGSFKDRGAAVLVSKAKEIGIAKVVEDSSGNAGCAIAAYAGQAGIECQVFVPESTSPAKLVQIRSYGARVIPVPGTRQQTAEAALIAAENNYYASHSWNPLFFEGTKTIAYEIYEQLGFRSPHAVVVPVGNGTLLLGLRIGFHDLLQAGFIDRLPRFFAVQAEACRPLSIGWKEERWPVERYRPQPTLAEGIAVCCPIRGRQILEAVRESKGGVLCVKEEEIRSALLDMGGKGYLLEPTAATAIAGCRRLLPLFPPEETLAAVITGHGLKAIPLLASLLLEGTKLG